MILTYCITLFAIKLTKTSTGIDMDIVSTIETSPASYLQPSSEGFREFYHGMYGEHHYGLRDDSNGYY